MRVLHLGPLYGMHGRRWVRHCLELGHTVYAAGHVRPGHQPAELEGLAEPPRFLPEDIVYGDMRLQLAWGREAIARVEPDLIHAYWLHRWGYIAVEAGRRPVITTPFGDDLYVTTGEERAWANRALVGADAVLALSGHMAAEIAGRGVPEERIHRVGLGVELDEFRPVGDEERRRLRGELGLPEGPMILSPRGPKPRYRLDVVLDAFALLRRRIPDALLVLALGFYEVPPELSDQLRGLTADDNVLVLGDVPRRRLARYMQAADLTISIPDSDGSPGSVWESMACGLPVVLSDIPQLREQFGACAAARLAPHRPEVVADALHEVLTAADADALRQAAREWAATHADEREHRRRLGDVYAATAQARAPASRDGTARAA